MASHYPNQCWYFISEVFWHSSEGTLEEMLKISILEMSLKITNSTLQLHVQGANESTHLPLDKMSSILAADIFKCIFLNEKVQILIKISLKCVPYAGSIDKNQALV